MYGAFCAFIVQLLRSSSRPVGCGCFGDAETGAGRAHLALNGSACIVAVLAAVAPPAGIGWVFGRTPLVAVALVAGVAAATFAAYLAYTAFSGAWRAYGSGSRL
jgi:hypothetical protein